MEKDDLFFKTPKRVAMDKNLSGDAILLYTFIKELSQLQGYCWASNSYFSDLRGVSESTIKRWLKELIKGGYIKVELLPNGEANTFRKIFLLSSNKENSPSPSIQEKENPFLQTEKSPAPVLQESEAEDWGMY